MAEITATVAITLALAFGPDEVGVATRYNNLVMREVYDNRLAWNQITPCPECVGMAALVDCDRLDDRIWLWGPFGIVGPVHVTDCACERHVDMLHNRGVVVDLAYPLAMELGVIDAPMGDVEVWSYYPVRMPRRAR